MGKGIQKDEKIILSAVFAMISGIFLSCANTGNEKTSWSSTKEIISGEPSTTESVESYDSQSECVCYEEKDRTYISPETLQYYCNTNESLMEEGTKVTGLIHEIPGLWGNSCLGGSMDQGEYKNIFTLQCATRGIVVAYLFPSPWSWMNKGAVRVTDLVVNAFMDKYG